MWTVENEQTEERMKSKMFIVEAGQHFLYLHLEWKKNTVDCNNATDSYNIFTNKEKCIKFLLF